MKDEGLVWLLCESFRASADLVRFVADVDRRLALNDPVRHHLPGGASLRETSWRALDEWTVRDVVSMVLPMLVHRVPTHLRLQVDALVVAPAGDAYTVALVDIGGSSADQVVEILGTELGLRRRIGAEAVRRSRTCGCPGVVVANRVSLATAARLMRALTVVGAVGSSQGPLSGPRLPLRWRSPAGIVMARMPGGLDLQCHPVTREQWMATEAPEAPTARADHPITGVTPAQIAKFCGNTGPSRSPRTVSACHEGRVAVQRWRATPGRLARTSDLICVASRTL